MKLPFSTRQLNLEADGAQAVQPAIPDSGSLAAIIRTGLQREVFLGLGLFFLGAVTRLPFAGRVLYHWDSINFALALERFDVAAGQPHAPGYILYVFLARAGNVIMGDPQRTMVAISIVSSGLATVILYLLGRDMYDRRTGLIAALFLASSPLFWFYGEIALPHSLDALAVILTVWLLQRVHRGEEGLAVPAAAVLALAGGLRPQTQVFLMALAIYAGWRLSWRRRLTALAVMAVVDLAWFLPLAWLSGGFSTYMQMLGSFYLAFNTTTSVVSGGGLWGIARNLRKLGMYTLYGWALALVPAGVAVVAALRSRRDGLVSIGRDKRVLFLLAWMVPALLFYAFIHMGQQGLVFVFLPGLLLLSAAGANQLFRTSARLRQAAIAGVVLGNCIIFLWAPTFPLGGERLKLLSRDTLQRQDAYYLSRFEAVRSAFPPENTLLLSSAWRFPQYYLPEYELAPYSLVARWELGEGNPNLDSVISYDAQTLGLTPDESGQLFLVLFDDDLAPFSASADALMWQNLPNGQRLAYLRFAPEEIVRLSPESISIVRPQE